MPSGRDLADGEWAVLEQPPGRPAAEGRHLLRGWAPTLAPVR
ncbi:hypothetical protein [Streptomyces minutiscleroticus]